MGTRASFYSYVRNSALRQSAIDCVMARHDGGQGGCGLPFRCATLFQVITNFITVNFILYGYHFPIYVEYFSLGSKYLSQNITP